MVLQIIQEVWYAFVYTLVLCLLWMLHIVCLCSKNVISLGALNFLCMDQFEFAHI